ncbi:hypothetical protein SD427_05805 [Chryseobacterium sp. JJR-5R]|uniref:hypothetical protein n=1 Tax=Chryseobacterium sp. JJR-5R TaxID=3093923 RepID=UPI002A756CA4|nr:hypothetical protein [Chryseobacterium sp. JJR-5R]WPO83846.1 hypothetical protein SD427_05805 [Chryseobacterium sp. JJR-5R]
MAITKQETYAFDLEKTGNFFAILNYKDSDVTEEKSECLFCDDVIYTYVKPTFMDRISDVLHEQYYQILLENISKLPKGALFIIFGFLLFLNISMLSIKERFQLQ